jgi:hypothetical protein
MATIVPICYTLLEGSQSLFFLKCSTGFCESKCLIPAFFLESERLSLGLGQRQCSCWVLLGTLFPYALLLVKACYSCQFLVVLGRDF